MNICKSALAVSILALAISLFGNITLYQVAHNNNETLCALRNDLQIRHDAAVQFLDDHPKGIPGISADALRVSIRNQDATLDSLSGLDCF